MSDFWGSIKETAKSIGGAVAAPPGVVLDLAMMPFDDEDDDFGSAVNKVAKRAGDIADPVFNPQTLTGAAFTKTMEGANYLLREGVSEPISTFFTQMQHASSEDTLLGRVGSLFSAADWAHSYQIAQQQNAGEAVAFGLLGTDGSLHGGESADPFNYRDPYEEVAAKKYPHLAPTVSWGANIFGSWYLDPFVLGGKAASMGRAYGVSHKLGDAEKAHLFDLVTKDSRTGALAHLKRDAAGRTDKYLDWIGGRNAIGRPLEAPEILHGTPELKKYAAEPHIIAGLLADANKIAEPVARRDAQRRILAVAAGDTTQIGRLKAEVAESGHIADTLSNMLKEGTLDLKRIAANPTLKYEPQFIRHLEAQLDNLNDTKSIDNFMDGWNARLDQMLGTQNTMPNLPGVHATGRRAVNRLNETGALRAPAQAHEKLDAWAAKHWEEAKSASTLFQKGVHSVPLLAVKPLADIGAGLYTKFPVAFSDSLRQTHFTGVAELHDWGGATTQLDSMMRLSGVPAGERMKTLSEAYLAKSEPEKMRLIDRVEGLSMRSMAREFSEKHGREIDRDYIETLMVNHANRRNMSLGQMRGRAYAATEMTPEMMATRGAGIDAAGDAARMEGTGFSAPDQAGKWRVDQINDDGTPLALPLLETQLANKVPLLDMGMARKLLERDHSYMSRLSRAWKEDAKELGRLSEAKRRGATGLEKSIAARQAAMDWSVEAGQKAMRVWKFGVLFRLGYPIRVLMDDHWRIWTQMNAATFYGDNGREFISNWRYNRVGRSAAGREAVHNLKVRRQEILDELEGDRMVSHFDRQAELKSIRASLRGHTASATRLRKQIEEAETKRSLGTGGENLSALKTKLAESEKNIADREAAHTYLMEQLGDYGPDHLKAELESIEEAILAGAKAHRPEKRTIGQNDLSLAPGVKIPGAYAGLEGHASREASKSHSTFEAQMQGVEDRTYRVGLQGSHRTIQPTEPGHSDAWADTLNHQFRQSPAAMHFINGGSVDEFVRWVKSPEQAALRQRLSHFAHDPEDWGHRVHALVHDYIPTDALREEVAAGRVTAKRLNRMFQDPSTRPAVHGRVVADNLGTSERTLGVSKAMNRVYKWIGEMPTDLLSRHPFFNSMYKHHASEVYAVKRAGLGEGHKFTQDDLADISKTARKLALHDLKRTLFDISAHSHAAHVMRFVSPFFAAHQEVISRWWRIVADDPSVVRRFQQAFDVPRSLGLVIDENGEQVKPGAPISREHRLLLQLPAAFGGPNTDIHKGDAHFSKWSVSENSFNLILQGGLTNPGAGPLVTVPVEFLAKKYADETEIARVARVFNPFPPQSPMESAMPATLKRLLAVGYATGAVKTGIGQREYNAAYSQNVQDLTTDFVLSHGREPGRQETQDIMLRAGRESTTDMALRFLWNAASPAPAAPSSKYSAIQHGWYQITEQARAEGRDYEWAYAQFKAKWGDAYMPLVYSDANNPAHLDATPGTVAALKRYRGVLDRVDPALTRAVVGAYADDLAAEAKEMGEYSPEARAYLRTSQIRPGSNDTYYSYDDPRTAMEEQMARRGWQKYGELTGSLTAAAQKLGLSSYAESDELVALKRAGVEQLRSENWAFNKAYGEFDSTQYDRYLDDMRTIVKSPSLMGDTERTDIQTLAAYLKLRDFFSSVLAQRDEAGFGGPDAQANEGIRKAFTAIVGQLVESNTYFETNIFNGLVERDPLLVGG